MGWTLDQVRDLTIDEHDEVLAWLKDRSDRAEHRDSGGATDVDAVIAAKQAKEARGRD